MLVNLVMVTVLSIFWLVITIPTSYTSFDKGPRS